MERERRRGWLPAALVVFLATVALALPGPLARRSLAPDAVGYVATAHDWLHGRGWVDPVIYSFYFEAGPPLPALAVRPPVLSALLVPPLALGADLTQLAVLHVLVAGLVSVGVLLLARRLMGLPAAFAVALCLAASPAWLRVSESLLTEVTAVGVLLLWAAWVERGLRRAPAALLLAGLTLLGVLTRPNLIVLYPAALLATLFTHGLRGALRLPATWVVGLGVPLAVVTLRAAVQSATGLGLYAHYAHMFETLRLDDAQLYEKTYVGALAFLRANGDAVLASLAENLRLTAHALFVSPWYLALGWVGVPALLPALARPGEQPLLQRALAFTALGLLASGVLSLGGFDPSRYPLPAVVCLALLAGAWLERVVGRLAPGARAARALPVAAALLLFLVGGLAPRGASAWVDLQLWRDSGTQLTPSPWDLVLAHVGGLVDPDRLVVANDPWTVHLWTGAAAVSMPRDLARPGVLERFLDERRPGYLLTDGDPPPALLDAHPRLERLRGFAGRGGLYRVRDDAAPCRRWPAPPPLALLGEADGSFGPHAPSDRATAAGD